MIKTAIRRKKWFFCCLLVWLCCTLQAEAHQQQEAIEKKRKVIVYDAWAVGGEKIYDDSRKVEIAVRVEWEGGKPPETEANLEVTGYAASKNVGVWRVDLQYELTGKCAEDYRLECRKAALETRVEILPKTLQVILPDAKKSYYSTMKIENLQFEKGKEIQISGFMKDGEATKEVPDGFLQPKLKIDEKILQQDSPQYQNGKKRQYVCALTLQEESCAGGNANYCYELEKEDFTRKGTISLIEGEVDFEKLQVFAVKGKCVRDERSGCYRISKGCVLQIKPKKGSGYSETIESSEITQSGSWSFVLERRDKKGILQARSKELNLRYEVDELPPQGEILLNGEKTTECYAKTSCVCSLSFLQDETSGKIKVKWYLSRKREKPDVQSKHGWKETQELTVEKEGVWYPYVCLEDAVGNICCMEAGKVVLDWTKPKIRIDGMAKNAIETKACRFQIFFEEANLEKKKSEIRLYRKKGEIQEEFSSFLKIDWKNGKVEISDPDKKMEDGRYVLKIKLIDAAGNKKQKVWNFWLNRNGIRVVADEETKNFQQARKVQQGKKLKFEVYDLNKIIDEKVKLIHNGEIHLLQKEKDYQRSKEETWDGVQKYTYELAKELFEKEGSYELYVMLQDEAGHKLSEEQCIWCQVYIDRTAPVCITDPQKKEGEVFWIRILCEDNADFEDLYLYKNEKLWKESTDTNSSWEISFQDHAKWRVEAVDAAGNKEIRYLIKEELEQELLRKELLPETEKKKQQEICEEKDMENKKEEKKTKQDAKILVKTVQKKRGPITFWMLGSMLLILSGLWMRKKKTKSA